MIIQKEHAGQSYRENHAFRLNQYEKTGELENTHRSIVTLTRFSETIYRNIAPVVVSIDGHSYSSSIFEQPCASSVKNAETSSTTDNPL